MKSKKNVLSYISYSFFAVFMLFLLAVNAGFFVKNGIRVLADYKIAFALIIFCLMFLLVILSLAALASRRLEGKNIRLLEILLTASVTIWVLMFRLYYLFGIKAVQNDGEMIFVIISLALSLASLFITYMIGRLAIGKIGAIAALYINGSLISEIASLGVFDIKMLIKTLFLAAVLLYIIFINETKKKEGSFVKKITSVLLMAALCGAVMVMSLYSDSTVMIPLILVIVFSVSILFERWIYSIVFVISFAVLSVSAIIIGSVAGLDSEYTLEQMVNDKASLASSVLSSQDGLTAYFSSGYKESFPTITDYSVYIMGQAYNYETLSYLFCIVLSIAAAVFMFLKKKNIFVPLMLYFILVYPYDNNQMFILALFAAYGLQEIYSFIRDKQAKYVFAKDHDESDNEEKQEEKPEETTGYISSEEEAPKEGTYASVYKSIYGSEEYLDDIVIGGDFDGDEKNEDEMSSSIPVINVAETVENEEENIVNEEEKVEEEEVKEEEVKEEQERCIIRKASEINEHISEEFKSHWECRRNRTRKNNN